MSERTAAPKRACVLTIEIQADARDGMVDALCSIASQIGRGEITTGCSGGPSSGWIYDYTESATPTHDEYFDRVREYLRAKGASEPT